MSGSETLVHIVFSNDGSVVRASETPRGASPQAWFDHLSLAAADAYLPLSGGRGVFRLAAGTLAGLQAPLAANHHTVP